MTSADDLLICIITGEPSGDLLGARLMAALKRRCGDRVRFMGVGGESMAAEGLQTLVNQSDLAVMGFLEVVPRIPLVLRRVREVAAAIAARKPAVVVTIDSWGFTKRVQQAVARDCPQIPRVHYVAPMVWAWKEKRAEDVARTVDHLMCLLPNEPAYFQKHGLACTHVGHSVIEGGADCGDGAGFREKHGIPAIAPVLCVLPGSRRSEISRLLPPFAEAVALMAKRVPDLRVVMPTVATVAADVEKAVKGWAVPVTVVRGEKARYDAFAAADAAMAASGTVSLELALARVPHLVAYRVAPLTAWLFRKLSKLRFVNLINLQLDRLAVPELLQEDCAPGRLAETALRLLRDEAVRTEQRLAFSQALAHLGGGADLPSGRAASVVLDFAEKRKPV
ncbi:lipid-A-disaccharide synthase [Novispirillum itersonii]|uniref:lipid-A-disaccharide synthase n=1 Tax=Novispirillum itersonii TaxID=189 RepID=UPI00035D79FF|nr:lipid-A-disaccharide synthase [Novispirillum itersonii]